MNKNKSIFITLVMAAMLAVIMVGAHRINEKAFFWLLAVLAGFGYLRGAGDLCRWLQAKDAPLKTIQGEEVKIEDEDPFAYDDEFGDIEGTAPFIFGGIRFKEGVFHGSEGD